MAEFIKVDALGDACPLPVVKAKKAISELQGAGQVEILVDNEKRQTPRQSRLLSAYRMPAPIRWWLFPLPLWAMAARSLARPCSRPLCLR